MNSSHFEVGVPLDAAQASDQRDDPTQREPARFRSDAVRLQEAAASRLDHGEFQELIFQDELNVPHQLRSERRTKAADFRALETLEDFDWPGEYLLELVMRRYENRSTIMTSNRPLEEWGKLLSDVPAAGAILDRFLHHATQVVIRGRSYRGKDSRPGSPQSRKGVGSSEPSTSGAAS